MADIMDDVAFTPRYDVLEGTSNVVVPNIRTDIPQRDMEIMKALYNELNSVLSGYVERIVDDYEYINSPIYDELGIDRETLAQIVDKVIKLTEEEMDDVQEINLETQQVEMWNRRNMFKNLIEVIVLAEIFAVRRPKFRRVRGNYVYMNGKYDGIKEK